MIIAQKKKKIRCFNGPPRKAKVKWLGFLSVYRPLLQTYNFLICLEVFIFVYIYQTGPKIIF